MRDMTHEIGAIAAMVPAIYAADNTPIVIDRLGFDSVTMILSIGVGGITFTPTNKVDFILEHSPDATTWFVPDPTQVLGQAIDATTGIFFSLVAASPNPLVMRLGYVDGYVGDSRYLRLRADFSGTHATGTALSAVALLGHPLSKPTLP